MRVSSIFRDMMHIADAHRFTLPSLEDMCKMNRHSSKNQSSLCAIDVERTTSNSQKFEKIFDESI